LPNVEFLKTEHRVLPNSLNPQPSTLALNSDTV
jgi:hypothetical protein